MRTVRVRIAVAVNEQGRWSVSGWHGCEDDDAMGVVLDGLDEGGVELRYWLEADLPIPEQPTIEATVIPETTP